MTEQNLRLEVRRFDELTAAQLYELLRLRVDVFVVEQNCPYRELDGRDQAALHVCLYDDAGALQAYLRVMDRGVESEHVSIGRVVTARRLQGLGMRVLLAGIDAARTVFHADDIYLEAQTVAAPFYEKAGFRRVSDAFPIDGIAHYRMILSAP